MYDYLVVGSGIFGSTFARLAKNAGKKVLVIEKKHHVGGNVYTEDYMGINIHKYGAHIFHTSDKEVYDFISNYCELKQFINMPIARYKDEVYNLPFNMNTFNKMFGVITPDEAREKIKEETQDYCDIIPKNLKEQALKLVGKTIFEKLIEGYTKKQWGQDLENLPPEIIRRLPLRFTYDNNYFNADYQGIPVGGFTKLIENLLDGIEVRLNTNYLTLEDNIKAKKVIYTGKIDEYFDYCFGRLEYRSLKFEEKVLDKEDFQGVAVVNYTEYEIPYTRIVEHKHFLKDKSPVTVLTYEYPANYEEGLEAYYPVNNEKNNKIYEEYKALASSYPDLIFGGRLGSYSYIDMDKAIKDAMDLAKKEGII